MRTLSLFCRNETLPHRNYGTQLMCAEKANELVSSRCKKNYLFLSLTESLSLPEFLFYVAKKTMGLGRISCKGGQ